MHASGNDVGLKGYKGIGLKLLNKVEIPFKISNRMLFIFGLKR